MISRLSFAQLLLTLLLLILSLGRGTVSSHWAIKVLNSFPISYHNRKLLNIYRPVKVIRLIAKHTVEELIKYRASKKLKLAEFALGEKIQEGSIIHLYFYVNINTYRLNH